MDGPRGCRSRQASHWRLGKTSPTSQARMSFQRPPRHTTAPFSSRSLCCQTTGDPKKNGVSPRRLTARAAQASLTCQAQGCFPIGFKADLELGQDGAAPGMPAWEFPPRQPPPRTTGRAQCRVPHPNSPWGGTEGVSLVQSRKSGLRRSAQETASARLIHGGETEARTALPDHSRPYGQRSPDELNSAPTKRCSRLRLSRVPVKQGLEGRRFSDLQSSLRPRNSQRVWVGSQMCAGVPSPWEGAQFGHPLSPLNGTK